MKERVFKLVINPRNDRVVDCMLYRRRATAFIIEGVYAIKHGATYEDIVKATHIFPILAEGVS